MGQLIIGQITRSRSSLKKIAEGLAPEAFSVIPEGFNNNIHWQLGHILVAAELFFLKGKETLPAEFKTFFAPGTKPADWTTAAPSVETVLALLQEQLATIQAIDVKTFDIKFEAPIFGNETVGEFAAMGAFHEAIHLGQIQALAKIVTA